MKTDSAPTLYRNALLAYGLVVVALLIGSTLTESRFWGINWYGYFGWYGTPLLLVVAVAVPLGLARRRRWLIGLPPEPVPESPRFWPVAVATAVGFGAAFVLLAANTHFLGDGLQLLARLATDGPPIRPWNPGVYFLQDRLYELLGGDGTDTARLAFRIMSWSAGLLFVAACLAAAVRLFDNTRDRLLFVLGLGTGGYALLFFGYVENYPLLILCVGLFALAGLLAARGRLGRFWLILPMALGGLFHPYSVVMLPAAAYLLLRETSLGRTVGALSGGVRRTAWLVGGLLAAVGLVYASTRSYFLRFALVPLMADRFTVEGYTLFSSKHLIDWFNLLFVLAPSWPVFLAVAFSGHIRNLSRRTEHRFLLLMLIPALAISFLFDPKLGMPRDWDIFGFVGVPLLVWIVFSLLDARLQIRGYAAVAGLVVTLHALVLAPRVLIPTADDTAVAWFDNISDLDVLKSSSGRYNMLNFLEERGRFDEAERRRGENARAFPFQGMVVLGLEAMQAGNKVEASKAFRRAIEAGPIYSYAWTNLGIIHIQNGQYDSALACLQISDGLNPYNSDTQDCLGQVYLQRGDLERGERYALAAARLDPENFTARANLLRLYQRQNRPAEFDSVLAEMAWLEKAPVEYVARSAALYARRGEFEPAERALRRALSMGLDSGSVRRFQQKYPQLNVLP